MYFCKFCGQPYIDENSKFCEYCGTARNLGGSYCNNCGSPVGETEDVCQVCGVATGNYNPNLNAGFAGFDTKYENSNSFGTDNLYTDAYAGNPYGGGAVGNKSRITAGILAIFFGSWGVHNFYLGNTKTAVTQLTLTIVGNCLFCLGIGLVITAGTGIWGFIEGILLLSGKVDVDGHGRKLIG